MLQVTNSLFINICNFFYVLPPKLPNWFKNILFLKIPYSHATQSGLNLVVEDNLGPLTPLQFSRLRLQVYPQSPFHAMDGALIYENLWKQGAKIP